MDKMQETAGNLLKDLLQFEQETRGDQANAEREEKALDAKLDAHQGIAFRSPASGNMMITLSQGT